MPVSKVRWPKTFAPVMSARLRLLLRFQHRLHCRLRLRLRLPLRLCQRLRPPAVQLCVWATRAVQATQPNSAFLFVSSRSLSPPLPCAFSHLQTRDIVAVSAHSLKSFQGLATLQLHNDNPSYSNCLSSTASAVRAARAAAEAGVSFAKSPRA